MNLTDQTRQYFNGQASQWERRAAGGGGHRYDVNRARRDFVLRVVEQEGGIESALEVGCGSGELACELSRLGAQVVALDFAEAMVERAIDNARACKVESVEFRCESALTADLREDSFDLVAANGFIEYITPTELQEFISKVRRLLRSPGSLVLSARNRLLNVFALNPATLVEVEQGTSGALLREGILLADARGPEDLPESPLGGGAQVWRNNLGLETYQYTPLQLCDLLQAEGFRVERLAPVNTHGAIPRFKDEQAEVHGKIARRLEACGDQEMMLLPFCSTFMTHAKRD